MTELKFVFGDPDICSGCMVCVNVCSMYYSKVIGPTRSRVRVVRLECSMYYSKVIGPTRSRVRVVRLEPALDFPLFCRNCEDAPCIEACPEGALTRTSKGVVIVNKKKCNGTGACVAACPYNAIHIHPDTGKAIKCIQYHQCGSSRA